MIRLSALPIFVAAVAACVAPVQRVEAQANYGLISRVVGTMLQNRHFTKQTFNDEISSKTLENYLKFLDFSHYYFTKEDVDHFRAKYATKLDDMVLQEDISAAFEIYGIYKKRVEDRFVKIKELLSKPEQFKFDSDRSTVLRRDKVDWPANLNEADQLWKDIIEGELLQEKLVDRFKEERKKKADADKTPEQLEKEAKKLAEKSKKAKEKSETAVDRVLKRYERFMDSLKETEEEDIVNYFLSSLSNSYDPHSEYFSQSELDNFTTGMDNSLVGIGALLQMKDGAAQIEGIVLNGPADRSGQLQVNDRIIGVGQGNDGEMVDVMYMKLQKIVELIRGKEGSVVRLKVIPADADDPSMVKEIKIVREEVKLKDKLATAEIIDMPDKTKGKRRVGWITIPSFYADMETNKSSMTVDVEKLLGRLMKEKIEGLIIDLRGNGGGSLDEAVNLTGLFIPSGPVVQAKDKSGRITWRDSSNPKPMYEGPLMVLTDKASASASEIFAAALQDYGRAIVVGDTTTFGKGTVQTILPVAYEMPFFSSKERSGALKVTIQKFYRIAGGSTQLDGVAPDIVLPSVRDLLEMGEASLTDPMPHDEIAPRPYKVLGNYGEIIQSLKQKSEKRLKEDPEFIYLKEDSMRLKKRLDDNVVSLNEEHRVTEQLENEERLELRKKERKERIAQAGKSHSEAYTIYALQLDTVDRPELTLVTDLTKEASTGMKMSDPDPDEEDNQDAQEYLYKIEPMKLEALRIAHDFLTETVDLAPNTAAAGAIETAKPVLSNP